MERVTKRTTTDRAQQSLSGVLVAMALVFAASPRLAAQELKPVPEPSLDGAEAGLRQRIEAARDALASLSSETPATEKAALYGRLGSLYLLSELRTPAAAALTNAWTLDPSEPRWPYLLALVQQDLGDLEAAENTLRQVLELRPGHATVRSRLAETLRRAGKLDDSRRLFQGVLAEGVSPAMEAYARFGLGRIAMAQRRFEDAVEHLETVRRLAPEAGAVGRVLGLAYREVGRVDEARRAMASSGEEMVALADPWATELTQIDTGAYLSDAVKARLRQDYDEAARLFRLAIDADPERSDPKTGDALRGLAEVLFVLGDPAASVEALREAVDAQPERADLHAKLGEMLTLARRPAEAVGPYRRAVELDPNDPQAHLGLGRVLAMTGRHDEALGHYDQCLELAPDGVEARALKARALSRLERHAEAAVELERALALDPGNVRIRLAHVDALARAGDTVAVRDSLEAGVASSDDPRLVATLIQVLVGDPDPARRDPQRAVALGTELLQKEPSVAHAVVLARALYGAGRVADAAQLQARALDEARSGGAPEDELAALGQALEFYRERLEADGGAP